MDDDFCEPIKKSIDEVLKLSTLETCPGPVYSMSRKHMARISLDQNEELEAIYNLTESHGVGLRQIGLNHINMSISQCLNADYLSFTKGFAEMGKEGLLKRLKEMPAEWTIVQLTREFDPDELITLRSPEMSPKLKNFHITRLPCGSELEKSCVLTQESCWPDDARKDILQVFWDIKKNLRLQGSGPGLIRKIRKEASAEAEGYCRDVVSMALKYWLVLFLGKICDTNLENSIRNEINPLFDKYQLNKRQKYLIYLIAEGSAHLSDEELDEVLFQSFDDNEELQDDLYDKIKNIKHTFNTLPVTKRHPVLLILDEHLDVLPWENFIILRRHTISRIPSVHFAHMLYTIHKDNINNGLREIPEDDIGFYVLNPDGDMKSMEELLSNFFKKRFPDWNGIIGNKPTEKELIEALTNINTYIYCGHGSGSQYMSSELISQLKIKPVQLLFGCSSVALLDHGGSVGMTGHVFQYMFAGSGCTIGALWPVTTGDVDQITMNLANIWLPGTPINVKTLEPLPINTIKKEPELLRALKLAKESALSFSNKAALIARGIPIKIVEKKV